MSFSLFSLGTRVKFSQSSRTPKDGPQLPQESHSPTSTSLFSLGFVEPPHHSLPPASLPVCVVVKPSMEAMIWTQTVLATA